MGCDNCNEVWVLVTSRASKVVQNVILAKITYTYVNMIKHSTCSPKRRYLIGKLRPRYARTGTSYMMLSNLKVITHMKSCCTIM